MALIASHHSDAEQYDARLFKNVPCWEGMYKQYTISVGTTLHLSSSDHGLLIILLPQNIFRSFLLAAKTFHKHETASVEWMICQ